MLSPRVWNFKPPSHQFTCFSGAVIENKAFADIDNHFFNHNVTLVLPDTVLVPEDLNSALTEDTTYYKVNQLSVSKFLDRQFIESFVKVGQLTGLSEGTHIDTDNCAAITPCGHLVLNLLKETYQSLGLEGSQSKFSSERYVVQIDLKHSSFTPGKKNYERTVKCLTQFVNLQMDFLIAWEPPEPSNGNQFVCPSSVAAYLSSIGYTVTSCVPQALSSRQYGVRLPSVTTTDHSELLEWLGAVALGVDMSREDMEGQYLSKYTGPFLQDAKESQIAVLNYQGFFTTTKIRRLFTIFSLYVEKRKDIPFAVLHTQGFSDSPVCWNLQEHTFHSDGDNHYTIILKPDCSYLFFKSNTFVKKMKLRVS